jgi:hypothetical protein
MKETFVCVVDKVGKVVQEGKVKADPGLIAVFLNTIFDNISLIPSEEAAAAF